MFRVQFDFIFAYGLQILRGVEATLTKTKQDAVRAKGVTSEPDERKSEKNSAEAAVDYLDENMEEGGESEAADAEDPDVDWIAKGLLSIFAS